MSLQNLVWIGCWEIAEMSCDRNKNSSNFARNQYFPWSVHIDQIWSGLVEVCRSYSQKIAAFFLTPSPPLRKALQYTVSFNLLYVVTCDEDQKSLQRVVDKVKEWCDQWLLSLNVTKCYHMSYSSRQSIDNSYYIQQKESTCIFQKVDYIKDLI